MELRQPAQFQTQNQIQTQTPEAILASRAIFKVIPKNQPLTKIESDRNQKQIRMLNKDCMMKKIKSRFFKYYINQYMMKFCNHFNIIITKYKYKVQSSQENLRDEDGHKKALLELEKVLHKAFKGLKNNGQKIDFKNILGTY